MREIKFRAWNTDYKEMWNWNDIKQSTPFRLIDEAHNIIFLQYTGLKDKKGVEIYEGDIVYTENYGEYPMVIKWDNEYASFYCYDKSEDHDDHLNLRVITAVIGNIYENQELL